MRTYNVKTFNSLTPELQLEDTDDKTKYSFFYSASKAETIINESDIDGVLNQSVIPTIISNI